MLLTNNIPLNRIISGTWKNVVFSLVTSTFAYFINELWLSNYFTFPVFVPTVLGTALAFFIGFNNNQAYDRWWEARKIWGSLVNNSRTWAREVLQFIGPSPGLNKKDLEVKKIRLVKRHIAFLYALKSSLRNSKPVVYGGHLAEEEQHIVEQQTNIHNAILTIQLKEIDELYKLGNIDGFQLLELNKMLTAFCDDMGKSERIRNTVYPTSYNYYSKLFIWIFVYSITMTIGNTIGVWSIIFGVLLGYIFFTIQAIGEILLDPFNDLPSCVPLDQITRTIEINLLEMLGESHIPLPFQSVRGEYIT